MKTLPQIKSKIKSLKRLLSKREVRENFGEKEIQKLDDFIDDFWSYPQDVRLQIYTLQQEFAEWCYSYTG